MIVMYWVDSDDGAPKPHEGYFWYCRWVNGQQLGHEANDCVWLVPGTYVDE